MDQDELEHLAELTEGMDKVEQNQNEYYINRNMCTVLEEMRKMYESRNFAGLLGLVEEVQSMGNRMEAGLKDKKDLLAMRSEWHKLKAEILELRRERERLVSEKAKRELEGRVIYTSHGPVNYSGVRKWSDEDTH